MKNFKNSQVILNIALPGVAIVHFVVQNVFKNWRATIDYSIEKAASATFSATYLHSIM